MSLVQLMTPINLQEERRKFFEKGCKYNPQFKYSELVTLNKLYKYGKPKPEYLELAQKILDEAFDCRDIEDIKMMEGKKIGQTEAKQMINSFLEDNNLQDTIEVMWSKKFIANASYYKNKLKIQLPLQYRKNEFKASLYHELGTHALRRLNYAQQPFFKQKQKYGFKPYMKTEEGLASLNSLIASNFKLNYISALNYIGIDVAQKSSFSKTYNFFMNYLRNEEEAWRRTTKHKRGLYDTSEKGGFTKDVVYFEGMIEVWNYLINSDFNIKGLYYGKISYKDVNKAKKINPKYRPIAPSFIREDLKRYEKEIKEIGIINYIS